jgi:hypothetical protein
MASARPPLVVVIGFALFLLSLVYLVATSFAPRSVQVFALTEHASQAPEAARREPPEGLVRDTMTIDARDETRWTYVSLATGTPASAAGPWDLAIRRFTIVPSDAAVDLGPVAFDSVRELPDDAWTSTTFKPDMANDTLRRWYEYGLFSHLLTPARHIYGIRTADRRYAKIDILSYYCPGPTAGCLTFRYAYQPDGTRVLN